ncbi:hypothetical protein FE634_14625 [Nocardioides dongxiaopingii]|uniref:hypothetical protein n=1 Tax=Nocardioides sp. S-1144 TaxID=2582905 RepID=UPI00110DDDA3|nr:hypothetical protein [Nocardioides sp. S-1144]QCW51329.1 hypothetical protein FE634_14625 [Nocardioides sp. S-1144]
MTTEAVPASAGVVRHESFAVAEPPQVLVHVGADPVVVELVEGSRQAEVHVALDTTLDGNGHYERFLQAVRGTALGADADSEEGLRSHLLSSTEITCSSFDRRLVVRSPQRGAVRFGTVAITVRVPAGSDLVVRGDVVTLDAIGAAGDVRVKARRGEVHVASASSLDLRLRQGSARVDRVHGPLTADLRAASLEVADLGGDADVVSSRGAVALTLRPGGAVDLSLSTAGTVDLSGLPPVVEPPAGGPREDPGGGAPARRVSVASGTGQVRLSRGAEPTATPDVTAAGPDGP